MSKCPCCKKLHTLKRELCDTCYMWELQKRNKELEAQLEKLYQRPTKYDYKTLQKFLEKHGICPDCGEKFKDCEALGEGK